MGGDSQGVAGIEPLSIAQLEDRLQLAMAVREQLRTSGVVHRHQISVAVESIGFELPASAPLASFTEAPSATNLKETLSAIDKEERDLRLRLQMRTRAEIRESLQLSIASLQRDLPPHESNHNLLKVVGQYLHDYVIPQTHEDPMGQSELKVIDDAMVEFGGLYLMGHQVLDTDGLYRQADALWERVQEAFARHLTNDSTIEENSLLDAVSAFTTSARMARVSDPDQQWSPQQLVSQASQYMESFTGAIPYKLQDVAIQAASLLEKLDSLRDQDDLNRRLVVARSLQGYLNWCWIIEEARGKAVVCAIRICRAVGHLRSFTA